MGWGRIQISFSFPTTICWRDSFPFEWSSHLWKIIACRCLGLFLDSQSYFIDLYFYSQASPILFWLLYFIVSFEIKKNESSNLVLFLDLLWLFAALCNSMWILELSCLFMQKGLSDFDRDDSESIDCFAQYHHLNDIKSLNPWAQNVFPFI